MDELSAYPCFLMILDDVRMLPCSILAFGNLGDERSIESFLADFLGVFSVAMKKHERVLRDVVRVSGVLE